MNVIFVLALKLRSALGPIIVVGLRRSSGRRFEQTRWAEVLPDLRHALENVLYVCRLLNRLRSRESGCPDVDSVDSTDVQRCSPAVIVRVTWPETAGEDKVDVGCRRQFLRCRHHSRINVAIWVVGVRPRDGAVSLLLGLRVLTQAEGVVKVDGVPARKAIQVEPPAQADEVELREIDGLGRISATGARCCVAAFSLSRSHAHAMRRTSRNFS